MINLGSRERNWLVRCLQADMVQLVITPVQGVAQTAPRPGQGHLPAVHSPGPAPAEVAAHICQCVQTR